MPPPVRKTNDDYHFHAYDYTNSTTPWEESPAVPDRDNWQFYSMVRDLRGLRDYGNSIGVPHIELREIGSQTHEGRKVMALSFGNKTFRAPSVLITGGLHAREWVAPEIAYLVAEYLVMHYTTRPSNDYEQAIHDLVHSRWIHFIPMVNPDGNMHTVFGPGSATRMWRKNRRPLPTSATLWVKELCPLGPSTPNQPFTNVSVGMGGFGWAYYDVPNYDGANKIPPGAPVYQTRSLTSNQIGVDLNRNFDTVAWGYDAGPHYDDYDPRYDSYFGPRRTSETETDNVGIELTWTITPRTSIDYHSYGQLILYPTESSDSGAVDADYQRLGKALQQLVRAEAKVDYQLGDPIQLVGYSATGTIADRIAQDYQAHAFTIELDPDSDNPGFKLPETGIRTVFEKNIRGALGAIAAPSRGAAAAVFDPVVNQFLAWDVYGRGNRLPKVK